MSHTWMRPMDSEAFVALFESHLRHPTTPLRVYIPSVSQNDYISFVTPAGHKERRR